MRAKIVSALSFMGGLLGIAAFIGGQGTARKGQYAVRG